LTLDIHRFSVSAVIGTPSARAAPIATSATVS
jgi:hypothetical protein